MYYKMILQKTIFSAIYVFIHALRLISCIYYADAHYFRFILSYLRKVFVVEEDINFSIGSGRIMICGREKHPRPICTRLFVMFFYFHCRTNLFLIIRSSSSNNITEFRFRRVSYLPIRMIAIIVEYLWLNGNALGYYLQKP